MMGTMSTAQRIGTVEDNLLVLLGRYVRARADQLTRHSHSKNSLRFVRTRLARMAETGYVQVTTGFSQKGPPPNVYALTTKGWHYVGAHFGMPMPTRWKPSEGAITDYRDYLHDLAITDFGIAVERFCREADPLVRFVEFRHDRFLPQARVTLPDHSQTEVRLDGFLELHIRRDDSGRKKQRCHLLEIDLNTHYRKAIQKKLLAQLAYLQGGHYERDFGTTAVTYLWVCPGGHDRITQLVKIAEETFRAQRAERFAPLFLFTHEDPATIDPLKLFTDPCWRTPFQPDKTTLLGFSNGVTTVRLEHAHYLGTEAHERFLQAIGEDASHVSPELDLS
jgi:hypothetical protein